MEVFSRRWSSEKKMMVFSRRKAKNRKQKSSRLMAWKQYWAEHLACS